MARYHRTKHTLTEVVPDVHMVDKTWGSNVYFVEGPTLTLVDAGFPLDARRLADHSRRFDPRGPALMVATHCHLDHMGSMARLKSEFGSRVMAHVADADIIEGTTPYMMFKLDPIRAVYYKMLGPLYPYETVGVDERLEDGDVLDVLGGLRVVHLPGHTQGSVALFQEDKGLLFTGDTVRNEGGQLDGPPPQFTPDIDEAYEGIEARLLPLEFEVLLPGHGDPIARGARGRLETMIDDRKRRG